VSGTAGDATPALRASSAISPPSGDHPLAVHSGALDHDRGLAWVAAQHRERRGDRGGAAEEKRTAT
jgi:hypothetical protein